MHNLLFKSAIQILHCENSNNCWTPWMKCHLHDESYSLLTVSPLLLLHRAHPSVLFPVLDASDKSMRVLKLTTWHSLCGCNLGFQAFPAAALVHLLGDVDVVLLDGFVGNLHHVAVQHRDFHARLSEPESRAGPSVSWRLFCVLKASFNILFMRNYLPEGPPRHPACRGDGSQEGCRPAPEAPSSWRHSPAASEWRQSQPAANKRRSVRQSWFNPPL